MSGAGERSVFAVIYPDSVDVAGSMADVVEVELDDVANTCALDTAVAGVFHPAIVTVPDDRSIYCHPYSMTFNSPDWKRMWTNTAVLASAYVGTLLVLECLPADATSWNRAEIQDVPLFKRWYNHVIRSGPEIDHDNPIFNYVLHPYAGRLILWRRVRADLISGGRCSTVRVCRP